MTAVVFTDSSRCLYSKWRESTELSKQMSWQSHQNLWGFAFCLFWGGRGEGGQEGQLWEHEQVYLKGYFSHHTHANRQRFCAAACSQMDRAPQQVSAEPKNTTARMQKSHSWTIRIFYLSEEKNKTLSKIRSEIWIIVPAVHKGNASMQAVKKADSYIKRKKKKTDFEALRMKTRGWKSSATGPGALQWNNINKSVDIRCHKNTPTVVQCQYLEE